MFSEFTETPIASASLAQVHGARLLDGTEVAVKVQYPDIEDIVRTDLRNMERACRIYEWVDPQPLELLPLLARADHARGLRAGHGARGALGRARARMFANDRT